MHSKREPVWGDWRLYLAVNDAEPGYFKVGATNNVANRLETLTAKTPYSRHTLKPGFLLPADYHRKPQDAWTKLTTSNIIRNTRKVQWRIVRSFSSPRGPSGVWDGESCQNIEAAFHVALEQFGLLVVDAASNQANPKRCRELFRLDIYNISKALKWLEHESLKLQSIGAPQSSIGKYDGYSQADLKFIERLSRRLHALI